MVHRIIETIVVSSAGVYQMNSHIAEENICPLSIQSHAMSYLDRVGTIPLHSREILFEKLICFEAAVLKQ